MDKDTNILIFSESSDQPDVVRFEEILSGNSNFTTTFLQELAIFYISHSVIEKVEKIEWIKIDGR